MDSLINLYKETDPTAPLSNDAIYNLALSLMGMSTNYPSLSLLHIAIAYVASHPLDSHQVPRHTAIDQAALLELMSHHSNLN